MRAGCISYVLRIGTAMIAAILLAAGTLILVFGAFNLDSSGGIRTVITVVAALVAVYLFVRVGKDILRDLRSESSDDEKEKNHPHNGSGRAQ